ncbi:hypothetical protein AB751O23_BA_00050 [Chlamydiales bacterium SCGC AB-751-O23]|jgi:hypothetical protein|nr:hypothetical protein AB751O23_BA_00050 [Chlamydiales bacterium SCGC AB-751-O23]
MKWYKKNLPFIQFFLPFMLVISIFSFSFGYLNLLSEEALKNTPMGQENLSICQFFSSLILSLTACVVFVFRSSITSFKLIKWGFSLFLSFYLCFLLVLFPFCSSWDTPSFFFTLLSIFKQFKSFDHSALFQGVWVFSLFNVFTRTFFLLGQALIWGYFLELASFKIAKKVFPFLVILPLALFYVIPREILPFERVSSSFMGSINFSYFSFFGTSLVFNLILFLLLFGLIRFLPQQIIQEKEESSPLSPKKVLPFIFNMISAELMLALCFLSISSIWNQVIRIEYPNSLELILYLETIEKNLAHLGMFSSLLGAIAVYLVIKYLGYRLLYLCLPVLLLFFGVRFFLPLLELSGLDNFDTISEVAGKGETYRLIWFLLILFIWTPVKGLAFYALNPDQRFKYKVLVDFPFYVFSTLSSQFLLTFALTFFIGGTQNSLYFLLTVFLFALLMLSLTLKKMTRALV